MYHEFSTTVVEYSSLLRSASGSEGHNYDHLITKLTDTIASAATESRQVTPHTSNSTSIREALLTQLYTINADDFSTLLDPKLLALYEYDIGHRSDDVTPAPGPKTEIGNGFRPVTIDDRFNMLRQVYRGILTYYFSSYSGVYNMYVNSIHYTSVRYCVTITEALLFCLIGFRCCYCCCYYRYG